MLRYFKSNLEYSELFGITAYANEDPEIVLHFTELDLELSTFRHLLTLHTRPEKSIAIN